MHDRSKSFTALLLLGIFVLVLVFSLFLNSRPVLADPDGFYHIGVAQEMNEHGIHQNFPWLPYTTLSDVYADQHFLYHVFLMPFVRYFDPLFGAQLATAITVASLITLIAALLLRFRIRFWLLYVVILLVTNPFLFRMNLVKAPAFSLIFLVVGAEDVENPVPNSGDAGVDAQNSLGLTPSHSW